MAEMVAAEHTWETRVASYDVGPDWRLRLLSLLRLQQEVGERHLSEAGLAYTMLYDKGLVFVLVRLASVIYRAPAFGEPFWLTTWHRDNKGARFYRCYRFTDAAGNILIDSVSAFALVEPGTHKPLRPAAFERVAGVTAQPWRVSTCPDPGRWTLPEGLTDAGERPVRWSDLDCNNHLGNTEYPDIACDVVAARAGSAWRGRRVAGFELAFLREAREGDRLALACADGSEQAWVAAALINGAAGQPAPPCFEMRLDFAGGHGG